MKISYFVTISLLVGSSVFGQDTTRMAESEKSALEQRVEKLEEDDKKWKGFKFSGYIQALFQYGEKDARLNVGGPNKESKDHYNRFGIRRGRLKLSYEYKFVTGVLQFDLTEKGFGMRDAYVRVKEPWINVISLTAGLFDTPFGYEIMYSSSKRESPERARIFPTLFPKEKDLGMMLTFQAPKTTKWSMLKLDAGLFSGNGVNLDIDNKKNFVSRLRVDHILKNEIKIGGGVSYYHGGMYQGTANSYRVAYHQFVPTSDSTNIGRYAPRTYVGGDFQLNFKSVLGETKLSSDYVYGVQSAQKNTSESHHSSSLPTTDTYVRTFQGGYVKLVQSLGKLPVYAILKYDVYDPNVFISGNSIGLNFSGKGDVSFQTFGFGLEYKPFDNLRFTAYYDLVKSERSINLPGYEKDLKDNVFSLRMHYSF